jgi:NAD(P)-dependent dehydrogenase (short-subunit alcohol dehydrogenase family)
MKLSERVAIVVGGGQTPGASIGNGRASAALYAREGAKVLVVDRYLEAAEETVADIIKEGGTARAWQTDATQDGEVAAMVQGCVDLWGRVDILHNNVGMSIAAGDAPLEDLTSENFDRVIALNLKTTVLATKYVIKIMREQESGVITNLSSLAATVDYPNVAYKAAKAGVNAFTQQTAIMYAPFGIRCNALVPGQINTPFAIESRVGKEGMTRQDVMDMFAAIVPLKKTLGTAWDIAKAAVFLASDDASFITGVILTVDGAQSLQVGGQGVRLR